MLRIILGLVFALLLGGAGLSLSPACAQQPERFPKDPWPMEIVENAPFRFTPSSEHRRAVLFPWSVLLLKEQAEPTFADGELKIANAELAAYWRELYPQLQSASRRAKVSYVNHFMNRFQYGEDIDVWGVNEYWATPREFLEKGAGDCKAIAIAKYFALRALKVPSDDMYLVTVNEPGVPKDAFHLVLVVLDGPDLYVLDMQNNKGVTVNSAYARYTIYDYFNETVCREVVRTP